MPYSEQNDVGWDETNEREAQRLALLYAQQSKETRRVCFERLEQENPPMAEHVLLHLAPLVLLENQQVDTAIKEARQYMRRQAWRWIRFVLGSIAVGVVLWYFLLR